MNQLLEMIKENRTGHIGIDVEDFSWSPIAELECERSIFEGEPAETESYIDRSKFIKEFYIEVQLTYEGNPTLHDPIYLITYERHNDIPFTDWEEFLLPGEEMPID